jgi:hypothetical protein
VVSPLCVVLGTLVVSGFLAQFASRANHRRSQSTEKPRRDPTPPPETGALERAYARQAVVANGVEVGEEDSSRNWWAARDSNPEPAD